MMDRLEKGKKYTGIVEGYSSEGLGIVRLDSAVVFVPGAVRGESIVLQITRVMKNFSLGEIVQINSPSSPARKESDCPCYQDCGGCAFRHVTYQEELCAKRQRVQDALSRLGNVNLDSLAEEIEILGAKSILRYRNKSQFPVGSEGQIGFYRSRTHQVIPVHQCLIQSEAADQTAEAVRLWMQRYQVSAYHEQSGKGLIRHVYVRVNQAGESLCCLIINGRKIPREPELAAMILQAVPKTIGILLNYNTKRGNVILGEKYRTIWGQNFLLDTLCGLTFKLSVPSFYQVNREQAEVLYAKALEFADLTGTETILDLYCGVGTITLYLARHAKQAIGAEVVAAAVRDAQENACRNQIQNAIFYQGDASVIAARLESEGLHPDIITVDPPRKGLAPQVIASIATMAPPKIIYVSCDPATLGRDLARFRALGYHVHRACAVDLFPRTHHVESVVLLSKGEIDS